MITADIRVWMNRQALRQPINDLMTHSQPSLKVSFTHGLFEVFGGSGLDIVMRHLCPLRSHQPLGSAVQTMAIILKLQMSVSELWNISGISCVLKMKL